MPELPEVETVRNTLKNMILGETINDINIFYDGIIESDLQEFKTLLIGETFKDILRYGKYLIFILDNYSIVSHLRMEGKYFVKNINEPIVKHEHVIFNFVSGKCLRYHDTRKFGTMNLIKSTNFSEIMKNPELAKLGKEANDPLYNKEELFSHFKTSTPIKTVLLDQTVICGLGNIYVDEVLFKCNIHPLTPSFKLSINDANNILLASREVLKKAINLGGTTIRSYTSSLGVTGRFQNELMVHQRENEICKVCGSVILKTECGGRGTYFCPTCQHSDKIIYGITGSIGTGKSTVLNYLKEHKYPVLSCDTIVHYLYTKPYVKKVLRGLFGDSIFIDGEVNFQELGKIVYSDDFLRKQLESFIHPEVKKVIKYETDTNVYPICFVEIPLLFEANFTDIVDKIIVVSSSEEVQLERLMKRNNLTMDEAKLKISKQYPLEEKKKRADYIIDNSLDLCYTYKQIEEILK